MDFDFTSCGLSFSVQLTIKRIYRANLISTVKTALNISFVYKIVHRGTPGAGYMNLFPSRLCSLAQRELYLCVCVLVVSVKQFVFQTEA